MKRALFVVMLAAVSMGMIGCAAGEEDPVIPEPAQEAQRDPPKQSLNAQLRDPQAQLISGIEINRGFESVPAKQKPPIPAPGIEPQQ